MTMTIKKIAVTDLLPLEGMDGVFPEKPQAERDALKASMREAKAIHEPLTVLDDLTTVYKGRNRLKIATELYEEGIEEFAFLPCIIRASDDPIKDAWDGELTSRHWSGTQRAFVVFNLYRDQILARKGKEGGDHSKNLEWSLKSIAERNNTTEPYLHGFADLWRDCEDRWREVFELVWYGGETSDGPVSLNRLPSALGGKRVKSGGNAAAVWIERGGKGMFRGVIPRAVTSLRGAFQQWHSKKFTLEEKTDFQKLWKEIVAELPEELADVTISALGTPKKGARK